MECRLMIWSATSRITSGPSLPTDSPVTAVASLIGSSPSANHAGAQGPGRFCRSSLCLLWRNACLFRTEDLVRARGPRDDRRSVERFVGQFLDELRHLFFDFLPLDPVGHGFSPFSRNNRQASGIAAETAELGERSSRPVEGLVGKLVGDCCRFHRILLLDLFDHAFLLACQASTTSTGMSRAHGKGSGIVGRTVESFVPKSVAEFFRLLFDSLGHASSPRRARRPNFTSCKKHSRTGRHCRSSGRGLRRRVRRRTQTCPALAARSSRSSLFS